MTITLNSLSTELHLTPSYENEVQLKALITWCKENISQDIHYFGEPSEQYEGYYSLAKSYVEDFLPNVPGNLASSVAHFDDLNTIQYAAQHGYHYFLNDPKIPLDLVNMANKNVMTPLHISAAYGYPHTVKTLLAKGANPELLNGQNQNPLYQALFVPILHDDSLIDEKKEIFNMLAKHTPPAWTHQDVSGETVLHLLALNDEFESLAKEALKKAPTLAFTANNASRYPIHTAILNNQSKMVELLLNIPDVSSLIDGQERTALHYAARYGIKDVLQLCIKHSVDIDKRDSESKTPLLLAAELGNLEAVECLLAHGADVHAKDLEGLSSLDHAVKNQNKALEDLLRS